MKNINEYKRRFNTLMESEMGDVKPLINEQEQDVPLWRQVVQKVGDSKFTKRHWNTDEQPAAIIGDYNGKHIMVGKMGLNFAFSGRIIESMYDYDNPIDWSQIDKVLSKIDKTKRVDVSWKLGEFAFWDLTDSDVDSVVTVINELIPILGLQKT